MLIQGIGIALSPPIEQLYDPWINEEIETIAIRPYPNKDFYGLRDVPIDISHLSYLNPQLGDILFSPTQATLVAINKHQALYLDFKIQLYDEYIQDGTFPL